MGEDIISRRVTGVRTQRNPDEPQTVFVTYETMDGESFTFHMQVSEMAELASQMALDAKAHTN